MAKKDQQNTNTPTRKERRIERREDRRERKDEALGQQVRSEASLFGIDLDSIGKPTTSSTKENILQSVKDTSPEELSSQLDRFASTYAPAKIGTPPSLDENYLKQLAKKEKRAKLWDTIGTIGRGLQGKATQRGDLAARGYEDQRANLYKQYRDVTEANKLRSQEWERGFREDLYDFVDSKIKDRTTSETDRAKLELLRSQIEKNKADAGKTRKESGLTSLDYSTQNPDGSWTIGAGKNPLTELYYKIPGASPALINQMAKMAGFALDDTGALKSKLSPSETENVANKLISKAYDIAVDQNGNRIARMKPGAGNFFQELSTNTAQIAQLDMQISNTYNKEQEEIEQAGAFTREQPIRDKWANRRIELESKLARHQSNVRKLMSGESTKRSKSYGKRADGTEKGTGWLGEFKLPDGSVATEYSIGVTIDGKEVEIPTLVPTLTQDEIDLMVNDIIPNNKDVPDEIFQKAIDHAYDMIDKGRSPFKQGGSESPQSNRTSYGKNDFTKALDKYR